MAVQPLTIGNGNAVVFTEYILLNFNFTPMLMCRLIIVMRMIVLFAIRTNMPVPMVMSMSVISWTLMPLALKK